MRCLRQALPFGSQKGDTTPVSIPTLRQSKRGFGLQSSEASPQAVTEVQSHSQPLSHDISRISLRS
ncbi:hypothetical protein [Nostoc sp. 106C]|uniref:hypothetical protein n=1 Tax=Nostoc sp. 106C TaxID=1932667 RepID=UPI00117D4310